MGSISDLALFSMGVGEVRDVLMNSLWLGSGSTANKQIQGSTFALIVISID